MLEKGPTEPIQLQKRTGPGLTLVPARGGSKGFLDVTADVVTPCDTISLSALAYLRFSGVETIALRFEAIALRLEAIAEPFAHA